MNFSIKFGNTDTEFDFTFCLIISGYLPLTKIGLANHPDSNCCLVSAASTWDESLKMAGSAQFMFRVIPTLPKNKQTNSRFKQMADY